MEHISEIEFFKYILQSDLFSKSILLLLTISSIVSWSIIIGKWFSLSFEKRRSKKFMGDFERFSQNGDDGGILEKYEGSSLYKIYDRGELEFSLLKEKFGDRVSSYIDKRGLEPIERSLISEYEKMNSKLKWGMNILAILSSISVFIGLLGTVWGILRSFEKMSAGGGIETIGPSIAEALIATAVGLIVAIPASFFYNRYLKKIEEVMLTSKGFIRSYLNYVDRNSFQ